MSWGRNTLSTVSRTLTKGGGVGPGLPAPWFGPPKNFALKGYHAVEGKMRAFKGRKRRKMLHHFASEPLEMSKNI